VHVRCMASACQARVDSCVRGTDHCRVPCRHHCIAQHNCVACKLEKLVSDILSAPGIASPPLDPMELFLHITQSFTEFDGCFVRGEQVRGAWRVELLARWQLHC